MNNSWITRPLRPEDGPLIYATWMRGLFYGNRLYNLIEKDLFFGTYPKVINALLMRSNVVVACLESDPDVILGYAVIEGSRLHWVYVKKHRRRMGIAASLIPASITEVSHLTDQGMASNKFNWKYNPFL